MAEDGISYGLAARPASPPSERDLTNRYPLLPTNQSNQEQCARPSAPWHLGDFAGWLADTPTRNPFHHQTDPLSCPLAFSSSLSVWSLAWLLACVCACACVCHLVTSGRVQPLSLSRPLLQPYGRPHPVPAKPLAHARTGRQQQQHHHHYTYSPAQSPPLSHLLPTAVRRAMCRPRT